MSIYTDNGWLDIKAIEEQYPAFIYIIVGKRQVGKTYGVLKHMLDNDRKHILLRRTVQEVDIMRANINLSPYKAFEPEYKVTVFSSGKMCTVADYETDEHGKIIPCKERGLVVGLPTVANIRGFNGSAYTDVVFDEFIPEKQVIQRRSEGDALLNAYTTINGNRELKGEPPLKLWLLANTNSIMSPIVQALRLADTLIDMDKKNDEVYYSAEKGLCIIKPRSENITKQRKETALMSFLTQQEAGDKFMSMALENKFSYDDLSMVNEKMSVKGFKPFFSYGGMYVWDRNGTFLVTTVKHSKRNYDIAESDTQQVLTRYKALMTVMYELKGIKFHNVELLYRFKELFDIKDITI